jgi:hypothetical protein
VMRVAIGIKGNMYLQYMFCVVNCSYQNRWN